MTEDDASWMVDKIKALWPKADWTREVYVGFVRRVRRLNLDRVQIEAVLEAHRLETRQRSPVPADLCARFINAAGAVQGSPGARDPAERVQRFLRYGSREQLERVLDRVTALNAKYARWDSAWLIQHPDHPQIQAAVMEIIETGEQPGALAAHGVLDAEPPTTSYMRELWQRINENPSTLNDLRKRLNARSLEWLLERGRREGALPCK